MRPACASHSPREEMLDSRAGGEIGKTIRKVEKPGRESKETAEAAASRQDHWPATRHNARTSALSESRMAPKDSKSPTEMAN